MLATYRKKSAGRAVLLFAAVAFAIPWAGWTALNMLRLDWGSPEGRALFFTGFACSVGGLMATYVWRGRAGLVASLRSALRWRNPLSWWLFALALPLFAIWVSGSLYLAITRQEFVFPDWTATSNWMSFAALMIFIPGPLGEEFGWRGFLLPFLLERTGFVAAALITGVVWSIWHVPLYWGRIADGGLVWFVLFCAGVAGFSMLLAVLWEATGSLMLVMLMHFSINLSQNWTFFPDLGGADANGMLSTYVLVVWALVLVSLRFRKSRDSATTDTIPWAEPNLPRRFGHDRIERHNEARSGKA